MTQQQSAPGQSGTASAPGQAVLGPLTARDLTVLGSVLVIFIGSILPIAFSNFRDNIWNATSLFFVGIGVVLPLAVAALFLIRRLSPAATVRIGSLSVDQFASVVAGFAVAFFFLGTVTTFGPGYLVGLVGTLGLLVATVGALMVPVFAAEFALRPEVPAHKVARDAVPAPARPAPAQPVYGTPGQGAQQTFGAPVAGAPAPGAGFAAAPSAFGTPQSFDAPQASGTTALPVAEDALSLGKTAGSEPVEIQSDTAHSTGFEAPDAAVEAAAASGAEAPAIAEDRFADDGLSGSEVADEASDVESAAEPTAQDAHEAPAAVVEPAIEEPAQDPEPADNPLPATTMHAVLAPAAESIGASVDPAAQPAYEAFWFAVDRPKPVTDEATGAFLYNVEPGNWVLALADRGSNFLVQETDGRVGVLHDLSGIERAPEGA